MNELLATAAVAGAFVAGLVLVLGVPWLRRIDLARRGRAGRASR